MVPFYVKYMGVEAYGLVGFFAMLQAWFNLLDMGLTPTMARETARFNGGATDALSLRRLLRSLEGIFIGIALIGGTAMMAGAGGIASSWLNVQALPLTEVQHAIMLMAAIVALRWVCGLYRGAINGFERMVWLSGFNIAVSTARFVLVIPFFVYVGTSPTEFFSYQLVLAVIEVVVLVTQTYCLLPKIGEAKLTPWQWAPLRNVLKFSLSIAFTSSIWVMVTQIDKLLLSKLLPLSEYGYFSLAVLVASGVLAISGPVSGALVPRMSKLAAKSDDTALINLYRNVTQLVGAISIPVALVLAVFAEQVLWAWTGDADIAHKGAPILALYSLGNGILTLGAFPYYLQFAKGDLKLHMIGNLVFMVLLLPALIWATMQHGALGAGWAWLCANAIYFLTWVPIVHRRFANGLHLKWLIHDLSTVLLLPAIGVALAYSALAWPLDRTKLALLILTTSFGLIGLAAVGSPWVRVTIRSKWNLYFPQKDK